MLIGVLGAGTMGAGIAQVAAQNGHQVILVDTNDEQLQKAQKQLSDTMLRLIEKQKVTKEKSSAIQDAISYTTVLSDFAPLSFIAVALAALLHKSEKVFRI